MPNANLREITPNLNTSRLPVQNEGQTTSKNFLESLSNLTSTNFLESLSNLFNTLHQIENYTPSYILGNISGQGNVSGQNFGICFNNCKFSINNGVSTNEIRGISGIKPIDCIFNTRDVVTKTPTTTKLENFANGRNDKKENKRKKEVRKADNPIVENSRGRNSKGRNAIVENPTVENPRGRKSRADSHMSKRNK